MSGWDSRIKIRIDSSAEFEGPARTLNVGEFAAATKDETVEIRVGTLQGQSFASAIKLGSAGLGFAPLVVDDGAAGSGGDGGLVWWDGDAWQTGATPIEFAAELPSGAVTYTASTDTWATDASLIVPTSLDGGTFSVNVVAPSFSAGYSPQIGEA